MIATVMGKFKKPYEVNGNKGVSARLSLFAGEYQSDPLTDQIVVNGEYKFDLDDGKTRVKDVLVKREDGSFVDL